MVRKGRVPLEPGIHVGEVASGTHSLRDQKGCVPLEPDTGEAASETPSLRGQKDHIASEPGTGEVASGIRSLRGQKGCIASKPDVASGTRSLRGQKEERVTLDTGEFVTYMYLGK